jgi:hypothetical protein
VNLTELEGEVVQDVIFIAVTVAAFVALVALVIGCERILGPDDSHLVVGGTSVDDAGTTAMTLASK